MNCLFAWAYDPDDVGLSEFSTNVFLAFDQAEFHHDQPLESGPEFHTVPRLKNALAAMAKPYIPADAIRRFSMLGFYPMLLRLTQRRADIHQAILTPAWSLIRWRYIERFCQAL
jgi:hypothetical protein